MNESDNTMAMITDSENEPDWFRNGDAWVKLFLEPIAPGKFKQHDHVYDVPGKNEFPKEQWSSKECQDGFHITRRRDVWFHLVIHGYKSAYIAEVVSMGDEFYDNAHQQRNRKVRVVTFGPAVPLTEVLGKHPDDFNLGQLMSWSAANNHIELLKLAVSKNLNMFSYSSEFHLALVNGNDSIADFLIEKTENEWERQYLRYIAIRNGRAAFVERLMENIPVDVLFFKTACASGQFEIFQLLRAKYGEPPCRYIIESALDGGNVDILNYIKSRGVDMSDFEMFVYACTYAPLQTVEYLVSEGADVKHPLIAYFAKKHAFNTKVREFLLAQIDDKSEVHLCEKSEGEIGAICYIFLERIKAGEFDGE
jgi:hypothetical protein